MLPAYPHRSTAPFWQVGWPDLSPPTRPAAPAHPGSPTPGGSVAPVLQRVCSLPRGPVLPVPGWQQAPRGYAPGLRDQPPGCLLPPRPGPAHSAVRVPIQRPAGRPQERVWAQRPSGDRPRYCCSVCVCVLQYIMLHNIHLAEAFVQNDLQ